MFKKKQLTHDGIREILDYLIRNQQKNDFWGDNSSMLYQRQFSTLPSGCVPPVCSASAPLWVEGEECSQEISIDEISVNIQDINTRKISELVEKLPETFSQMLLRMIDDKGRSDVDVYKGANIDRKLFSKIRSITDYSPGKSTVLALAISLRLTVDEALDLLSKAGYTLSDCSRQDLIVKFFLEKEEFDLFTINEALYHFGETPIRT